MSRKPPAARRSKAACSSARSLANPINVAAVRWGTWLITATTWSCRSAGRATTSAPSSATTAAAVANVASEVPACGVSTHTAPTNIDASAPSSPSSSLPAIGCPPTKRASSIAATIPPFTLPTSVTIPTVSVSARLTWSASASTGVATNVIDASASRPIASITSIASARSATTGSRSSPVTVQPRSRSAAPIDPPIRPSPMTLARRITARQATGAGARAPGNPARGPRRGAAHASDPGRAGHHGACRCAPGRGAAPGVRRRRTSAGPGGCAPRGW